MAGFFCTRCAFADIPFQDRLSMEFYVGAENLEVGKGAKNSAVMYHAV